MARKLKDDKAASAQREGSFVDVGRNLRRAYELAFFAAPDLQADALMAMLLETSPHEMASC